MGKIGRKRGSRNNGYFFCKGRGWVIKPGTICILLTFKKAAISMAIGELTKLKATLNNDQVSLDLETRRKTASIYVLNVGPIFFCGTVVN